MALFRNLLIGVMAASSSADSQETFLSVTMFPVEDEAPGLPLARPCVRPVECEAIHGSAFGVAAAGTNIVRLACGPLALLTTETDVEATDTLAAEASTAGRLSPVFLRQSCMLPGFAAARRSAASAAASEREDAGGRRNAVVRF